MMLILVQPADFLSLTCEQNHIVGRPVWPNSFENHGTIDTCLGILDKNCSIGVVVDGGMVRLQSTASQASDIVPSKHLVQPQYLEEALLANTCQKLPAIDTMSLLICPHEYSWLIIIMICSIASNCVQTGWNGIDISSGCFN